MSLDTIIARIEKKLKMAAHIKARIKLDFGDDGLLLIDGTQSPPVITQENGEADTTFICPITVFQGILDGTQDPTMAYMMGRLKIKGSMGIAMKLNSILED
ncbi:MAG: SCP2 sterol-binding domain-containing protein [Alphaproteobacteria bacterium]